MIGSLSCCYLFTSIFNTSEAKKLNQLVVEERKRFPPELQRVAPQPSPSSGDCWAEWTSGILGRSLKVSYPLTHLTQINSPIFINEPPQPAGFDLLLIFLSYGWRNQIQHLQRAGTGGLSCSKVDLWAITESKLEWIIRQWNSNLIHKAFLLDAF